MQIALTIAGSDSGGGAGIQADLKTFSRFGIFGTSVITAITAQNTVGVTAWDAVSPALVRAQLDAVVSDLRPLGVKTGMLGDAAVVRAVADGIRSHELRNVLVVDPVMVSTSGDFLLAGDAVTVMREQLLPLACIVTPNLDEARALVDMPINDQDDMAIAARRLVDDYGASAALVKGGHLSGNEVVDILYDGEAMHIFRSARIDTTSTHGTGCTLSAAIAAHIALGESLLDAVAKATQFVHRAIAFAPDLGRGHGPLNHFV